MLRSVFLGREWVSRESVKDCYGQWICDGVYVVEALGCRQGWVTEVVDNNNGYGEIKVRVVRHGDVCLDERTSYVTDFQLGTNWCKA